MIDIIRASPVENRIPQRKSDPKSDLVVVSWNTQWVQSMDCFCVKVQLMIPQDLMAPPALSFMLSFGSTTVAGDIEMLDPRQFFNGYIFSAPMLPVGFSSISPREPLRPLVDGGSDSKISGTTIILGCLNDISNVWVDPYASEASECQPPNASENSVSLNEHHNESVPVGSRNKPPSTQLQKPPLLRTWIADANGYTVHTEAPTVIDGGRFLCTQCCERLRKQARSTSRRAGTLFNSGGPCSDQQVVNKIARYVATGDKHCICQRCSSRLKREAKLQKCFVSILFDVENTSESSRPRDRSYERTRPRRPDKVQPAPPAASSASSRGSGKSGRLQVDEIPEDKTPKRGKSKISPSKAESYALRTFNIVKSKSKPKASHSDWTENDATGMLEDAVRMTERQLQDGYNVTQEEIDLMNRRFEELRRKKQYPNGTWEKCGSEIVWETYSEYSRKETRTGPGSSSGVSSSSRRR